MTFGTLALYLVLALLVLFVIATVAKSVRVVPQASSVIVERLGRYSRTLDAGLHFLVPFIDKPRATVDLREQVVSFPPQPVITSDNLVVSIDTVIYFQPTDPKAATYEIANYIQGIEQLTVTTLRNVVGSLDLEQTLTSRDQINGQLRGVLDEATGRWGVRVNRVELKAIDPPASVQDSMEKQMRAERDRRAAILNAEGVKQSQILTAEGDKQSSVLRAEGQAQAAILEAQGRSRAIVEVFGAIHRGRPTPQLLAYQYLQTLPQIAQGDANKVWVIPSELSSALKGVGDVLGRSGDSGSGSDDDEPHEVDPSGIGSDLDMPTLEDPGEALRRARREAEGATKEAADSESATRRGRRAPVSGGDVPPVAGAPDPDVAPVSPEEAGAATRSAETAQGGEQRSTPDGGTAGSQQPPGGSTPPGR
ncbi:SPFH domain-containing protein [Pseudokineococcus sp. 1T1Z-3]|uniref:SPFH domain-containing protein n=1 Tax=Pseudokineococcus sp. 1T1Z-3 TaxID=3132745 RepID=UPI0030A503E1